MSINAPGFNPQIFPEKKKIEVPQDIQKEKNDRSENGEGQGKKVDIKEDRFIQAIETANKSLESYNTKFEFSIHEATKEIMVKIINTNTDEVIREIPPEKILDMVARMWELAGIIVDEKV